MIIKLLDFIFDNHKIINKIYLSIMFPAGFYRGINSIDYYDYKANRAPNKNELYINKFVNGLLVGGMYAFYFYGPIAIYKYFGRLEIELTKKNPHDYDYLYRDLSYTTLRPQKINK